ncbi:MAG: Asp-tRNA(Asn)/Glu-tRNA(Gln) amidotransferase subunit GatA [Spirochaetales bacterium]|nr:Asp-tRNA(Asn)/Glu-tRNA(Gln) amidotransferase subunit GatA [Spirochaetales bacterium]
MKTALELIAAYRSGKADPLDVARACLERARSRQSLGAFLRLDGEQIERQARASKEKWQKGTAGPLEGIPISIKDNICEKGERVTCASRMLEHFVSPYDATVVARLKDAGAILFGRTNMDEFAMGSSTENSAFQKTLNPWNEDCVPGGSSGGAAASVAAGITPLALGSDTGGSIRQPAAFCGIAGLKPTYGMVSRYGLVAFASSLDQIGPMAASVDDLALALSVIRGRDVRDATSSVLADQVDLTLRRPDYKKVRIGLPGFNRSLCEEAVVARLDEALDYYRSLGATIVDLPFPMEDVLIPVYYVLAPAEASSNLSRFDGVRYGYRSKRQDTLLDLYTHSRSEGLGPEVKRRILTGTYVLSSGYYDAYYKRAQALRESLKATYQDFFKKVDVILQPTTPTAAFRFGEKSGDPLAMYQSDVLTVAANLAGVPAVSIPAGQNASGLPLGLQLTGMYFEDGKLLSFARDLAANFAAVPENAVEAPQKELKQKKEKPEKNAPKKKTGKKKTGKKKK